MALLKALVIGMGVLIVGAMGLLAYGLITKTSGDKATADATGIATKTERLLAEVGDIVIPDSADCRIEDAITEGRRLTVTLGGTGTCSRVVVVDLATGAILAQIRLAPGAP